jgi:hypothetical protein
MTLECISLFVSSAGWWLLKDRPMLAYATLHAELQYQLQFSVAHGSEALRIFQT